MNENNQAKKIDCKIHDSENNCEGFAKIIKWRRARSKIEVDSPMYNRKRDRQRERERGRERERERERKREREGERGEKEWIHAGGLFPI